MNLRAAWRRGVRSLGGEVRRAVFSPRQFLLLALVFLGGVLLTWALSVPLGVTGSVKMATPAEVAASYLVALGLLSVTLARLPVTRAGEGRYWPHFCAWLGTVDLAVVAFLGIWLAPGSGMAFAGVMALVAVTCAYTALLAGGHALLCVLGGGPAVWMRAVLCVTLAAAVTGLLWTRLPLQALQRGGDSGVAAYNTGTQAVAVLSPVMGLSAYWNGDPSGFNLTKTTHMYQLWLGPSFISFPRLWPGRSGLTEEDQGPFGPGLVLGLLMCGLVLVMTGDLAGMIQTARQT